jgi:hypothetical protein
VGADAGKNIVLGASGENVGLSFSSKIDMSTVPSTFTFELSLTAIRKEKLLMLS